MRKLDWGDAQIWMETAEMLYLRYTRDSGTGLRERAGYPGMNELNVAAVCAGYAFELIFKVLVRAGGNDPDSKHQPSAAYKRLTSTDRVEVDKITAAHSWNTTREFLDFLDEYMCHGDRKYWMKPKKGGPARANFHIGGRVGIDALKKLHGDLSNLAIKRIDEDPSVYEVWPGTDRQ